MKRDVLGWLAMGASIAVTAQGEWSLAVSSGYHPVVAGALPVAIDAYAIRALRTGREVLPAVLAMVATNSAAHLLHGGMLTISPALVVAVSAIAPLVLWRMHVLKHDPEPGPVAAAEDLVADAPDAVRPADAGTSGERTEVTVERVDPDPVLEAVPWPRLGGASVHPALQPVAAVAGHGARSDDGSSEPNSQPTADASDAPPADQPDAECPQADLLAAAKAVDRAARAENGRPASLRRLQAELRIGQSRAQQLQRALAAV
ncbi:hypothetical protein [Streptomyces sp. 1331.2]|uniref:hypothetical protein n=1 Tax=Streptomyces sp. 1331.2 TaxID=1938835 RepID=UPI000BD05780|nr:hypothetical protein [Streptomyces sp. 1331.2]SOB84220.1 hypothetical protein SAMN06272789_4465 [Streptomyces sp. 1331.2]